MVRCAMCDSPAMRGYYVEGQGFLRVCESCRDKLAEIDKERITGILKKLINKLNEHYTKIPLAQAPTRKFENNGKRWGLKTAITEIEKELERLIKE